MWLQQPRLRHPTTLRAAAWRPRAGPLRRTAGSGGLAPSHCSWPASPRENEQKRTVGQNAPATNHKIQISLTCGAYTSLDPFSTKPR
jgi:hypothetical protein